MKTKINPTPAAQFAICRALPIDSLRSPVRFVQDSVRELELKRRECLRARRVWGREYWLIFS